MMISKRRMAMPAETIWNDLRKQQERPIFRRADETHPYDIYVGIDADGAPVLMLLSSRSAEQLPRLKSLAVSQNIRHDGRFALLITLSAQELVHPFSYVCDDLIEGLRHVHPPGQAVAFLLARLQNWRRLLEGTKRRLSHEELLGLIGEILLMERLIPHLGPRASVNAWLGPAGASQDFQTGGHFYEVKSCAIGSHTVTVSSLEQLHTSGAASTLIVFFIGAAGEPQFGSFSANSLIARVRQLISDPVAASAFDGKLLQVGFDESQPESDGLFILDKEMAFDVRDEFPRLTPLSVPRGILGAKYYLDLEECLEFEISISQAINT